MANCYYRDNFIVTTAREFIQLDALHAAFDSDLIWWAESYPDEVLKKLVDTSLCFGLYCLSADTKASSQTSPADGKMIGFGRLVTDYVTTGYLTDVYVLDKYQGKGLGKWLIECISRELESWPHMRQAMLLCSEKSCGFYEKTMGAEEWNGTTHARMHGIRFMIKDGPGRTPPN